MGMEGPPGRGRWPVDSLLEKRNVLDGLCEPEVFPDHQWLQDECQNYDLLHARKVWPRTPRLLLNNSASPVGVGE